MSSVQGLRSARVWSGREDCVARVLGIPFWNRTCDELLSHLREAGGVLVVPSAPSFCSALEEPDLWRAHIETDYAVMDSGYLALLLSAAAHKNRPKRISGHQVIEKLFNGNVVRTIASDKILWVVPGPETEEAIRNYMAKEGFDLERMFFYQAPMYADDFRDETLAGHITSFDPRWVIICISGGRQEKLAFELRDMLPRCPAILCTGAAIFFFSGAQAKIPRWVDRAYLGWLWRICSDPKRFGPRYWNAFRLPLVLWKWKKSRPN